MSITAETSAAVRLTTNWAAPEERTEEMARVIRVNRVKQGKIRRIPRKDLSMLALETWNSQSSPERTFEVNLEIAKQFMPYMKVIAGGEKTIGENAVPFTIPVIDGTLGSLFRQWVHFELTKHGRKAFHMWSASRRVRYVCLTGRIGVNHEGHVDEKTGLPVPVLYTALDIWMMNKLIPGGIDLILESLGLDPADNRCFPMNDSTFVVYSTGELSPNDANVYFDATSGVEVTDAAMEFWADADKEFIARCEGLRTDDPIETCKARFPPAKVGKPSRGAGEKPRRSAGEGSNTRTTGEGPSRAKRGAK